VEGRKDYMKEKDYTKEGLYEGREDYMEEGRTI
jgi:hypothetical protein